LVVRRRRRGQPRCTGWRAAGRARRGGRTARALAATPTARRPVEGFGKLREGLDLEVLERAGRARVALDHGGRKVPGAIGDPAVALARALRPRDERGA